MDLKRAVVVLCALGLATIHRASLSLAFEFDAQCLELRKQMEEAAGTEQEVAEETETDPRLLTALLSDQTYVCTAADKDYLTRQVAKDAKLITAAEQIVAKCPQYIDPEPIRKQLTGDDADPFSKANVLLSAFSETKQFLNFASEAAKLHKRGMDICNGKSG